MRNAIILHGRPSKEDYYNPNTPSSSNFAWIPWLQKQLIINDIYAQTPEIPNAWNPDYSTWKKEFERYDITPETGLAGHSCSGGFLVRWLSEQKDVQVGTVVLVAPSLGLDWEDQSFFDFEIDPNIAARTKQLVIFGSNNDKPGCLQAIAKLRATIPNIKYKEFTGYGHFTPEAMGKNEFPELVQELTA